MARKRSKSSSILPILILCIAVALWAYDAYDQETLRSPFETGKNTPSQSGNHPHAKSRGNTSTGKKLTGRYETYRNCILQPDRANDGDSFRVKLPDGRTEIFRLYFVDAPETAFKTYRGGRNNHDRIAEQAVAMGDITSPQVVEIGKDAKDFVLTHLGKSPFTIHTEWDSPFNDQRYHAFVVLNYNRKVRFLHELLVEKGYARIHTKGSELPDGTSRRKQESHLRSLERTAKTQKTGAWAVNR